MGMPNSIITLCKSFLLTELYAFLKYKWLMHSLIVFPFLHKYLTNAEYIISSWPVTSKVTLLIPNNVLCMELTLTEGRLIEF